jgi:tetratricopeptide (TPR) repeat protein
MGKEKEQSRVVNEQLAAGDKVALFMHKRSKVLLPLVIIVAAGVVFSVAFFLVRSSMEKKAIAKVEAFEQRKNELGESAAQTDIDALLADLNSFAPGAFGYAASRAYSLIADIHFSKSNWKDAEENWVLAAEKASKIYLGSVSLFNAAVAAEEQGNREAALDYYNRSLLTTGSYPAAARARFNIARIHEAQNDRDKALAAYRELIEKSPNSPWTNLAHDRLIVLEKN